ncbi:MAG: YdcF family protein [Ruminococcaceae bacterium]|nr:YdcF family protein [Oscillospiraceae bacterium]
MIKRYKCKIILASGVIILLLIAFAIGIAISIWNYGKVDEKAPADVAIVLGAAISDGEVSPVYRERINHAITLYKEGTVDSIILTGGFGEGSYKSDSQVAKEYALSQDVPEERILIEEKSTITEENLEFSKEVMEENDLETAIIVSDPLHMKRAMLMAEDYNITALSSPTPTSMYKTLKTKIPFLLREEFFYVGYCIVRVFR